MQELRCPNCGTPYNPGDAFCGECGQALPAAESTAQTQPIADLPQPSQARSDYRPEPSAAELSQPEIRFSPATNTTPGPTTGPTARTTATTTNTTTKPATAINPLLIGGGVGGLLLLLLAVFVLPGVFRGGGTPTPTVPVVIATVAPTVTQGSIVGPTDEPPSPTSAAVDQPTATVAVIDDETATPEPPTPPLPTATLEVVAPTATAASQTPPTEAYFRIETDPSTLDPQLASSVVDVGLVKLLFEPLLTLNDQLAPVPAAAESWEVSADGTVYTVKLRSGLVYSDGSPISADDFVNSWKRLLDPSKFAAYAPLAYVIKGAQDYYSSSSTDPAELQTLRDAVGVQAIDPQTIQFTLTQAASYFPYLLTLPVGAPVPASSSSQPNWDQSPQTLIGSGPYVLKEWTPNNRLVFAANPNYRNGSRSITQLQALIIPDESAAISAYRAGQLDWMLVDPASLDTIDVDPQLKADLARSDGSCTNFLVFNNQRAPFKNGDVRRAFVQATDRANWAAQRLGGVKPANSLIPPGQPGYQADLNPLPFSPDAAKQRLKQSNTDVTSIEVEYVPADSPDANPLAGANKQLFDWLKGQIATNLGVTINLKPVTQTQYDSLFNSSDTTPLLWSYGWCQDYPDPQNWLSALFNSQTGQVYSGWQNNAFDTAVNDADREPDQQKRLQLYGRAQTLLAYDAPVLFYEWVEHLWLIKPQWQDLRTHLGSQDTRIPGFNFLINGQ